MSLKDKVGKAAVGGSTALEALQDLKARACKDRAKIIAALIKAAPHLGLLSKFQRRQARLNATAATPTEEELNTAVNNDKDGPAKSRSKSKSKKEAQVNRDDLCGAVMKALEDDDYNNDVLLDVHLIVYYNSLATAYTDYEKQQKERHLTEEIASAKKPKKAETDKETDKVTPKKTKSKDKNPIYDLVGTFKNPKWDEAMIDTIGMKRNYGSDLSKKMWTHIPPGSMFEDVLRLIIDKGMNGGAGPVDM